ncbi:jerky protein homolog-like [Ptychodera flava]|uniref:jerky protein homolog-like n=1 Tax=Ptychodera flava TaxID=63121 RepID=UPI003969F1AB
MENLPVVYMASGNAWMTQSLFEEWFFNNFVPKVRCQLTSRGLEPKALLLLDLCPAYPREDNFRRQDGKIRALCLPANTTSLLQPMDQGIIKTFKANYRRELMMHLLLDPDYSSLVTSLQKYTIKDMCYIAGKSLRQVKTSSIEGYWMKGLGALSNLQDDISAIPEKESVNTLINSAVEHGLDSKYSEDVLMEWISTDDNEPNF